MYIFQAPVLLELGHNWYSLIITRKGKENTWRFFWWGKNAF